MADFIIWPHVETEIASIFAEMFPPPHGMHAMTDQGCNGCLGLGFSFFFQLTGYKMSNWRRHSAFGWILDGFKSFWSGFGGF